MNIAANKALLPGYIYWSGQNYTTTGGSTGPQGAIGPPGPAGAGIEGMTPLQVVTTDINGNATTSPYSETSIPLSFVQRDGYGGITAAYVALANGTTPSITSHTGDNGSISFATGSCNQAGTIIIMAGGSASSIGTVQVSFGTPFTLNGITVVLDLVDGTGTWAPTSTRKISAQSNSGFTIDWYDNSVALTNGQTYQINYFVIPR
jgi:hypothetical protein